MHRILLSLLAVASLASATSADSCTSDLDCSLNGECDGTSGACRCFAPWGGTGCGSLQYKVSPASGQSLFPIADDRNTWNGPIAQAPDGKFHMFNPVYPFHELIRATHIMHGVADAVEGPYNWTQYPPLPGGSNPAYLAYSEGGKTIHSVWQGGKIQVAETLEGPFTVLPHASYPGGNPAPVWHKGVFYLTNQRTTQIWSTPSLTQKWTLFANISAAPASVQHREDPFMWIDPRGYWHIINHAFTLQQLDHCGSSLVSIHSFSMDGRTWHTLDPVVQPYHHTVTWDDGTNHTYTTLERPNAQFNAQGAMTHINLAADLVTGDEGCKNRSAHCPAANPYCACTNCKYWDHAGSIIVALDV